MKGVLDEGEIASTGWHKSRLQLSRIVVSRINAALFPASLHRRAKMTANTE
jgi:hypothetical protein